MLLNINWLCYFLLLPIIKPITGVDKLVAYWHQSIVIVVEMNTIGCIYNAHTGHKAMASKRSTPPAEYAPGWLQQLDNRTALAADLRGRWDQITGDLGGADSLSYIQRSMIERCLLIEFWLTRQEVDLANGGTDFDAGKYTQSVNALSGLYSKLGLQRVARDANLADYLKKKGASA